MRFILIGLTAAALALAACDGDDGATSTPATAPTATPEIARTPATIITVPASFTPQPSPTLAQFDGVIMVDTGAEGRDYFRTDDGAQYGIQGITDDVEAQLIAARDGISRVRLTGTLLQPVPDVNNRQIRVTRIEPLSP